MSCCLSAAFSASSQLLGLNNDAPRLKRKNISATIAADVKRFCHQIKNGQGFRYTQRHQASWILWFLSGNERMRWSVALKYALSTAGAATQIVGSPTPPQAPVPPDGMTIDSTFGISAMRIELYSWKLVCSMRPFLTVHSW